MINIASQLHNRYTKGSINKLYNQMPTFSLVKTSQDMSKNISSIMNNVLGNMSDAQKTVNRLAELANDFIIPNMIKAIPVGAVTAVLGSALSATMMHEGTKERIVDTLFKTIVILLPTITLGMGIGAYWGYKKHEAKEKKDAATTIQKFARRYNAKKEVEHKKTAAIAAAVTQLKEAVKGLTSDNIPITNDAWENKLKQLQDLKGEATHDNIMSIFGYTESGGLYDDSNGSYLDNQIKTKILEAAKEYINPTLDLN